jgi:hypothetical protein
VRAVAPHCLSQDFFALVSPVPAAYPFQVLSSLALSGHVHLHRVKPLVLLLPEEMWDVSAHCWLPEASLSSQPVRVRPRHVQVEHGVAGALKEDHLSQGDIVEGTVWVVGEASLAAPSGEARVQGTARATPYAYLEREG